MRGGTGMSKNPPIKLSLGIKYSNNFSSGKHKFANRLIHSIVTRHADDIEIVERNQPSDVHITFDGKIKSQCKNIYRIDGVWINTLDKNLETKNEPIVHGLHNSNAIIFQSEFCETAVKNYFGIKPVRSTVIYNGADPKEFKLNPKYRPSIPSFAAICKWRPHKRLEDIIEGFLSSEASKHSLLHLYGEIEKPIKHPNVIYRGWSQSSHKFLPWCVASVHISYLDWCPNAVVESLVAGVPVIYANSGGTPFVVKKDGFAVGDHPWNYKAIDLYGKHPLNIEELAKAYDLALQSKKRVLRPDLYIDNVADRYVKYVQDVFQDNV